MKSRLIALTFLALALLVTSLGGFADSLTETVARKIEQENPPIDKVAVGSARMITGEETDLSRLYAERMTAALHNHTSLQVIERAQIEEALSEQELIATLSTDAGEIELGKIEGADGLLILVIAELPEGTELSARLLHTESGKILAAIVVRDFESDEAPTVGTEDAEVVRAPADERIGEEYRQQNPEMLAAHARLRELQNQHPERAAALREAHERIAAALRNERLFVAYVFTLPEARFYITAKYPRVARRLRAEYERMQRTEPQLMARIQEFADRTEPLVTQEPTLKNLIRSAIDRRVQAAAAGSGGPPRGGAPPRR